MSHKKRIKAKLRHNVRQIGVVLKKLHHLFVVRLYWFARALKRLVKGNSTCDDWVVIVKGCAMVEVLCLIVALCLLCTSFGLLWG